MTIMLVYARRWYSAGELEVGKISYVIKKTQNTFPTNNSFPSCMLVIASATRVIVLMDMQMSCYEIPGMTYENTLHGDKLQSLVRSTKLG